MVNIPADKSVGEDKIDDCIVKLLDPVDGIKLTKQKGVECFSGEFSAKFIWNFCEFYSELSGKIMVSLYLYQIFSNF